MPGLVCAFAMAACSVAAAAASAAATNQKGRHMEADGGWRTSEPARPCVAAQGTHKFAVMCAVPPAQTPYCQLKTATQAAHHEGCSVVCLAISLGSEALHVVVWPGQEGGAHRGIPICRRSMAQQSGSNRQSGGASGAATAGQLLPRQLAVGSRHPQPASVPVARAQSCSQESSQPTSQPASEAAGRRHLCNRHSSSRRRAPPAGKGRPPYCSTAPPPCLRAAQGQSAGQVGP